MEDYTGGAKADYTKGALRRMLLNFAELMVATTEPAIIYRWDIELAIDCLSEDERAVVFTMMGWGDTALRSEAVSAKEWEDVLERLYSILNRQGLVPRDSKVQRRYQTDKGRPFSPLEIYQGKDTSCGGQV